MLVGLLLLPACWAVSVAVYSLYMDSVQNTVEGGGEVWALPIGFMLWVLLFFLLPRPFRTYVLGHELTHALWAMMMGARVGGLKVDSRGGHVELSKSNFLITLAPYFFPFYTFIVIGVYYLAAVWVDVSQYKIWWLGAVGFTWSFHLTFTINMLAAVDQPDVQEHGRIFSYTVIYLLNVLTMGLWLVLVGAPSFAAFGYLLQREATACYMAVAHACVVAWQRGVAESGGH